MMSPQCFPIFNIYNCTATKHLKLANVSKVDASEQRSFSDFCQQFCKKKHQFSFTSHLDILLLYMLSLKSGNQEQYTFEPPALLSLFRPACTIQKAFLFYKNFPVFDKHSNYTNTVDNDTVDFDIFPIDIDGSP